MKFFKNKLTVTIILLSVTFLGAITYTAQRENKTAIENGAGIVLNPIQKIGYWINDNVSEAIDFFWNFSSVKYENEELKKENKELEEKLIEYSDLKKENETFREILDFKEQKSNFEYVGCNIIGYSGGSFLKGYIIDKGQKDGLEKGMVVISGKGLVGQVSSVSSNWSIVQSIVNENIAVAAQVHDTNDNTGIVRGHVDNKGNYLAKIENLPMNSNVKEGDIILTSGLGGIYPKNIKIGTVKSVEEDNVKVMKSAVIEPAVDFTKLEELFIIIPNEYRNYSE